MTTGINENATQSIYGLARFTTSSGWCIKYIIGFDKTTKINKATPIMVQSKRPWWKVARIFDLFFSASASAIMGVMAVEKPIPIDIAIKIKLLPSDTAANSVEPNLPTIILSTIPIRVWPNIPNMIG